MFYFDYNATSPLRSSVKQAMIEALNCYGNPSSIHSEGRKARALIENSRDQFAHYLGVLPQNIIFTSGATEANHLAIRGLDVDAIITSHAEHDAVLAPLILTKAYQNKAIFYIKHLEDGTLCQQSFHEIINEVTDKGYKPLLTLMKVNNETGLINDFQFFADQIHALGGYVHCDAVQALGKMKCDSWLWQCDAVTFAGHKVGGCKGVGVLMLRENIALNPLLTGGGQEMRRRAGTHNNVAIAGFGALIDVLSNQQEMKQEWQNTLELRQYIEQNILQINPNAIIVGHSASRAINTICLISQGIDAEKQVIIADLNKVALSSGAACSSGKVKSSHVLEAYGYVTEQSDSAIRISLGFLSCMQETEALFAAYKKITQRIHKG